MSRGFHTRLGCSEPSTRRSPSSHTRHERQSHVESLALRTNGQWYGGLLSDPPLSPRRRCCRTQRPPGFVSSSCVSERASQSDSPGKRRSRLGQFLSTKRDRYVSPPAGTLKKRGFNVVARRNERRFCVTVRRVSQTSPNDDPSNRRCSHQVCYYHYVGFLLQYTATAISGAASMQPKKSLPYTAEDGGSTNNCSVLRPSHHQSESSESNSNTSGSFHAVSNLHRRC